MLRNLINVCVLVMLLLQGVAQASVVDVLPHSSSMHCADHDPGKTDCPCCGDNWLGMATGCATGCAAFVAMSQAALDVPRALPQSHRAVALPWHAGPSYLPLTPPPIS